MHLSRKPIFIALLAISVVAVGAVAAPPPPKAAPRTATTAVPGSKLYRWLDKDGKVHYSDDLPPEALTEAREELSKSNGMTLKTVDRALTAEERATAQAKVEADTKVAAALAKIKQSDQMLLNSYPTEGELKRAFEERISMQVEGLKATRMGLENQQRSLSSFLYSASTLELSDKPVGKYLVASIRKLRTQIVSQQQSETQIEAQITNLRQESASTMAHYHELRSGAMAEHSGATPPPAASAASSPKG
ncbi:MAG TPA: DUF4124 domain-containing protein [Xanthomonadaceae bacterium]|jgi:hypothetical protein